MVETHEYQQAERGNGLYLAPPDWTPDDRARNVCRVQAAAGRIDGLQHSHHRALAAAVLGGTVSAATGGKFANGALSGAFSRAFNDELHRDSGGSDSSDESVRDVLIIGIQGAGRDKAGGNPIFRQNVEAEGGQILSKRAAKRAVGEAPEGTEIRLYGYSREGNAVVDVVNWAGRRGTHIHKVVTIDPHKIINAKAGFRFRYDNVGEAANYYQNNPSTWARGENPFWGRPVKSKYIPVEQHKFTGEAVTHLNIVKKAF